MRLRHDGGFRMRSISLRQRLLEPGVAAALFERESGRGIELDDDSRLREFELRGAACPERELRLPGGLQVQLAVLDEGSDFELSLVRFVHSRIRFQDLEIDCYGGRPRFGRFLEDNPERDHLAAEHIRFHHGVAVEQGASGFAIRGIDDDDAPEPFGVEHLRRQAQLPGIEQGLEILDVLSGETTLVRTHVLERESRAGGLYPEQELAGRGGLRECPAGKESDEQYHFSHTSHGRMPRVLLSEARPLLLQWGRR